VAFPGVKEDPLGGGGFSGVNVGHDADITFHFQHCCILAERGDKSNNTQYGASPLPSLYYDNVFQPGLFSDLYILCGH
jgi:hypothetical protein